MHLFALLTLLFAAPLAAQFTPVDETTYPRTVAAAKGKVALVNFWATWCVPCRKEMPQLVALESRLKPKGFLLMTVSADEAESESAAREFLAKFKVPAPHYLKRPGNEDKFNALIDAKWSGELPALILYDRSGRKVKTFFGETDIKVLEAAITKLL